MVLASYQKRHVGLGHPGHSARFDLGKAELEARLSSYKGKGQGPKGMAWTVENSIQNNLNLRPQVILVGGFEHFLFFHILGIIIPTD